MKLLDGSELAGFIKARQAQSVRSLLQSSKIRPRLAIIAVSDDPIIGIYMRLKQQYGADIGAVVDIHRIDQSELLTRIKQLNQDKSVHGIIVQLPLQDISHTEDALNAVHPEKDVDALGATARFDPATPIAILWLLAGYAVDLKDSKVVIIGRGRLVGAPLEKMLQASNVTVSAVDIESRANLEKEIEVADVIISATGQPGSLAAEAIPLNAVVVDAGVAIEQGQARGDLADDVYQRNDLKITPKKGGVGPLTVCALFENVIKAAQLSIHK